MSASRLFRCPCSWRALRIALCLVAPWASGVAAERSRVVLVHGIFQSGRSFGPMVRMLEAKGYECLVPKLKPADARQGLEPLAEQLKKAIDQRWGDKVEIHMVAHSMGGLISRHYLQNMGGYKRCLSLTTLASPHQGTYAAWCYPGKGARQMRPGSAFLGDLQATEHRLSGMTLRSYYTPMDLIILPYTNSHWDIAENRLVYAPAHPLVLYSPSVIRSILEVTSAKPTDRKVSRGGK